jgi:uncharacterized membrane protein
MTNLDSQLPTDDAPFGLRLSRRVSIGVMIAALGVITLWMIGTPPGVMGKAVAVGYAICHQIAERSFMITEGVLMPLCARCTGIYLGVMTGFLLAVAGRRTRNSVLPSWRVLLILGVGAGFMVLDGVNSFLQLFPNAPNLYTTQNWMRLLTGLAFGIALFEGIFPVFNSFVWREPIRERVVKSIGELMGVYGAAGVVAVLVLSGRPVFMAVLALLSALGVVLMLTIVFTVFFLSLVKGLNRAQTLRELALPLLAGLTLAMVEIGAINILRFALTGTWEGFRLLG